MKDIKLIKGTLFTLIAAAGFGAVAPIAKILYSYDITPIFMLAVRFFIASVFIWGYIFVKRNEINYRLEKEQLLIMFLIGGLFYFLTTTFYFNAINYLPVSLHVMIFYTYPFIVNIFSYIYLKEKMSLKQMVALFMAFGGILLVLTDLNSNIKMIGILLSVLAAVCNSAYVLALGLKKIKDVNSIVIAAYTNTFSTFTFITYGLFKGEINLNNFNITLNAWLGIVFIALVATVVAIIALAAGVKMIGAAKASIINTFEPIEGVILSIIILGENFFINQILGAILVIVAIIVINLGDRQTKPVKLNYDSM